MNKNIKATASLLIAVLMFVAFAPLAQAAPGNGPGEPNRGETQPARQGHAWDPTPVNPPPSGGPSAAKVAAETTALIVVVFADANANSIRDEGEVVLEGVFVALKKDGVLVRFSETSKTGQVVFLDLVTGDYVLDIRPQAGWSPALTPVTVVTGKNVVEIGLRPVSAGG